MYNNDKIYLTISLIYKEFNMPFKWFKAHGTKVHKELEFLIGIQK